MTTVNATTHQKELFGQPVGLYVLFFTEMWERFSYYGMRAILVLYLVQKTTGVNPGLGWANGDALLLYGWYTMLVYVACIPGGLIADNLLGQRKTVMWGAIILVIGHSILAIQNIWAFYSGLALIVIGVGLLKANISTMVGGLYKKDDIRRDKGFTIFYMGINLGALIAAIIVGTVGEKIGWHYGFGLAGIGMLLGLIVYLWGQKYIASVGDLITKDKNDPKKDASIGEIYAGLLHSPKQLVIAGILVLFSFYWMVFHSIPNGLLFLFIAAVTALMMMIYKNLDSRKVKDRFLVIILSFLLIIVFWSAFEQAGGLMSLYAKNKTNRLISSGFPLIGGFQIPASWFQSLNSMFILIFGVIVANFWSNRKRKNREASSIFKMAIGTIIMGFGFLFMAGAAAQFTPGGGKAGMYWLALAFLLQTIGELCSSPVSLSFVTKLSPVKYASLMMGLYFAATGMGNRLAGSIGRASQSEPIKIELNAQKNAIEPFLTADNVFKKDKDFIIHSEVYVNNGSFEAKDTKMGKSLLSLIKFDNVDKRNEVIAQLEENHATKASPYHADLVFEKKEAAEVSEHLYGYSGSFVIQEIQTTSEFNIFIMITVYTSLFGILVIILLKPLKRLTHGVEDNEHEISSAGDNEFEVSNN